MSIRGQGTATLPVTVCTPESWKEQRKQFLEDVSDLVLESHGDFDVEILGSHMGQSGSTGTLTAVLIERDKKRIGKHKLAKSARRLITEASLVWDREDPALPTILKNVIDGKGQFENSIGEFCLLYGKFEQKYGLVKGRDFTAKMTELLGDSTEGFKDYTSRGQRKKLPLPYAVRQILFHSGNNTNKLDPEGEDLIRSINLLKQWIR